jgi:hypothetical protein
MADIPHDHHADLLTQVKFAFLVQEHRVLGDGTKQIVENMFDLHPKAFANLKVALLEHIKLFIGIAEIEKFRIFANHNGPITKENEYHKHEGYDLGGIYYIQTPGSGGELEFNFPKLIVEPRVGMLCLFDANYEHRVRKFDGYDRYGIGINITLKKKIA